MDQIQPDSSNTSEMLKVLYDGECPLCRIEIDHVKSLANKNPKSSLCFIDISKVGPETDVYDTDRSNLLARFHIEHMDGSRLNGAKAFVAMWDRLPGWRWLAQFSRIPGMLCLMEFSYNVFLKIRPTIQSIVRCFTK